jgi:hypothetical protein
MHKRHKIRSAIGARWARPYNAIAAPISMSTSPPIRSCRSAFLGNDGLEPARSDELLHVLQKFSAVPAGDEHALASSRGRMPDDDVPRVGV